MGVVIHILTYVVPSSAIDNDEFTEMSGSSKIALALLPNVAMWLVPRTTAQEAP